MYVHHWKELTLAIERLRVVNFHPVKKFVLYRLLGRGVIEKNSLWEKKIGRGGVWERAKPLHPPSRPPRQVSDRLWLYPKELNASWKNTSRKFSSNRKKQAGPGWRGVAWRDIHRTRGIAPRGGILSCGTWGCLMVHGGPAPPSGRTRQNAEIGAPANRQPGTRWRHEVPGALPPSHQKPRSIHLALDTANVTRGGRPPTVV